MVKQPQPVVLNVDVMPMLNAQTAGRECVGVFTGLTTAAARIFSSLHNQAICRWLGS